jgi:hypothetical protein
MSIKNMDIIEFTEKVLGIKLCVYQKELLKAFEKSDNTVLISSISLGKTSLESILRKFREK